MRPRLGHAMVVYAYLQPVTDIIQIEDGAAQIIDNNKDPDPTPGHVQSKDHLFTKYDQCNRAVERQRLICCF